MSKDEEEKANKSFRSGIAHAGWMHKLVGKTPLDVHWKKYWVSAGAGRGARSPGREAQGTLGPAAAGDEGCSAFRQQLFRARQQGRMAGVQLQGTELELSKAGSVRRGIPNAVQLAQHTGQEHKPTRSFLGQGHITESRGSHTAFTTPARPKPESALAGNCRVHTAEGNWKAPVYPIEENWSQRVSWQSQNSPRTQRYCMTRSSRATATANCRPPTHQGFSLADSAHAHSMS